MLQFENLFDIVIFQVDDVIFWVMGMVVIIIFGVLVGVMFMGVFDDFESVLYVVGGVWIEVDKFIFFVKIFLIVYLKCLDILIIFGDIFWVDCIILVGGDSSIILLGRGELLMDNWCRMGGMFDCFLF